MNMLFSSTSLPLRLRKNKWSIFLGVALLQVSAGLLGATSIELIDETLSLFPGEKKEFRFGTVPQSESTVLLHLKSRINARKLVGSSEFVRIELNGRIVDGQITRTLTRLHNKPYTSLVTPNVTGPWYHSALKTWRSVYAPDFKLAHQVAHYDGDPYLLVLDVTDLTNPIADNHLSITHTAGKEIAETAESDASLVIEQLEIEVRPGSSPLMQIFNESPIQLNPGNHAPGAAAYRARLLPGGGLSIRVGQNDFQVVSKLSSPQADLHSLAGEASGKGWKLRVHPNGTELTAENRHYRLERRLESHPSRVEVIDRLTNLSEKAPLGLSVRHELGLDDLQDATIKIAGHPFHNEFYAPSNPTVHVPTPFGSFGMLPLDDVFRYQALLYTRSNANQKLEAAGIRTDNLYLPPGTTRELRWALYPVAGGEYFDFINQVRKDWKANQTVQGAMWWLTEPRTNPDTILDMPLEELRSVLLSNGIRQVQVTGSWVDPKELPGKLAFGTEVMEEEWKPFRERVRLAARKLREALPEVKVYGYYDIFRESHPDTLQRYAENVLKDENGKPYSTDFGRFTNESYRMVPTLGSRYSRDTIEVARRYITEMELDGVYWDEVEIERFNRMEFVPQFPDGASCILDQTTWTPQCQTGLYPLVAKEHRLAVIKAVQEAGGELLGNGGNGTLDDLHSGMPRMIEIQHNDYFGFHGNLQSPIGFLGGATGWESFLKAFREAMLPLSILPKKGESYGYTHQIMPYLFPFTPIELYPGYLAGQERIIATHSGNYGWEKNLDLALTRHFDTQGRLSDSRFPFIASGDQAKSSVTLKEGEAVVLERVPVQFHPQQGSAEVTVQAYGPEGVQLTIRAEHGGKLILSEGPFTTKQKEITVTRQNEKGQSEETLQPAVNLECPVEAAFEGTITLRFKNQR